MRWIEGERIRTERVEEATAEFQRPSCGSAGPDPGRTGPGAAQLKKSSSISRSGGFEGHWSRGIDPEARQLAASVVSQAGLA